ncbi:hypothetical protein [Burkholderia ubonensis]|uniref:hypothetical protein n=1 Tax=Burkholderia ubonensis TaxID=101571 RepID=UPI000A685E2A|nr:hypothetical protein [Burkholderia ubonensis]
MKRLRKSALAKVGKRGSVKVVRSYIAGALQGPDLAPPSVDPTALGRPRPDGTHDGVLKASIRDDDLNINVPVVAEMYENWDAVLLILDGQRFDSPKVISADHMSSGLVDFSIPANSPFRSENFVFNPYHKVEYILFQGYTSGSGGYEGAPNHYPGEIHYIVDYTAPGPNLSPPEILRWDLVKNGLTPAVWAQVGEKIEAEIASYGFQDAGDLVYLLVDGVPSAAETVEDFESLFFDYGKTLVEQAQDGDVLFQYRIEDRAGNMSTDSRGVTIKKLLRIGIDDLRPPTVPDFVDKGIVIIDDVLPEGVLVEIPFNAKLVAGDKIQVVWGGQVLNAVSLSPTDLQSDPLFGGAGNGIRVLYAEVRAALGVPTRGQVTVEYRVLTSDGNDRGSSQNNPLVLVDVTQVGGERPDPEDSDNPEDHDGLVPLTIRVATGGSDNVIPPDKFGEDATAIIPWENVDGEDAFVEGDEVQVFWKDKDTPVLAEPRVISDQDVQDKVDLEVPVDGGIITDGGSNPQMPVWYVGTRFLESPPDDQINKSKARNQLVNVQSRSDLPGGDTGLNPGDFPDAEGPALNRHIDRRVAQGGTRYEIEPYDNQSEFDYVDLVAQIYDNPGTGGNPVGPDHRETKRAGSDNLPVEFLLPEAYFLNDVVGDRVGRIEVVYTVRQDKPGAIPVSPARASRATLDTRPINP